jgi:hypothetical protein
MRHFLLFFGLIAFAQQGNTQDLNAGLLVHYNFNGNANDVSGNGMHATTYGPILDLDINGIEGAYYFDGIDDYMQLPGNSTLKPQLPVTFYCYLKVNSFDTYNNIINTDDFDNVFTGMWMSSTVEGRVSVGYGNGGPIANTSTRRIALTTNALELGQWHYVVGIIRGPTDMEIWIDCEPQELTYSGTGGALQYSPNPGVLGKMDTGNSLYPANYSHVTMDGLAFWNRDLTEEEIGLLCQGGLNDEEIDNSTNDILVYPNPANGDFVINLQEFAGANHVSLFDVSGKLIQQFAGNEQLYQVTGLNPGVYLVYVTNEQKRIARKVVGL